MIAAGRLVPTLAAGMVVGSYLQTKDGQPPSQLDILEGDVRVDTGGLAADVGKVVALHQATIDQVVMLGTTSYYIGKAMKERYL